MGMNLSSISEYPRVNADSSTEIHTILDSVSTLIEVSYKGKDDTGDAELFYSTKSIDFKEYTNIICLSILNSIGDLFQQLQDLSTSLSNTIKAEYVTKTYLETFRTLLADTYVTLNDELTINAKKTFDADMTFNKTVAFKESITLEKGCTSNNTIKCKDLTCENLNTTEKAITKDIEITGKQTANMIQIDNGLTCNVTADISAKYALWA